MAPHSSSLSHTHIFSCVDPSSWWYWPHQELLASSIFYINCIAQCECLLFSGRLFSTNTKPLDSYLVFIVGRTDLYLYSAYSFIMNRLFKVKKVASLYFLMFSISLVFLFLATKLTIERFSFYFSLPRYWEFCLGAIIFFISRAMQIETRGCSKKRCFVSFIPIILLIYLILFGPHNPLYVILTIVLFFRFIFYHLDFALPKVLGAAACYIGDRSYSIYLVHMPIIWIFSYSPILTSLGYKEKIQFQLSSQFF